MHLVIVGPGSMPIPPRAWGAVEILIWDYKTFLQKYHPDILVTIVNEPRIQDAIKQINDASPDVVHIQWEHNEKLIKGIHCKNLLITTHHGYLQDRRIRSLMYWWKTWPVLARIRNRAIFAALSPEIAENYRRFGVPDSRLVVMHNGANDEIFRYTESPAFPERTIYLGKIDARKRQSIYQGIQNIWFAGQCHDRRFNTKSDRYLGEWEKDRLYAQLTDYANLALISDGEAHALVCCEALVCGLGLVVSEHATANLDLNLPFITVIPRNKMRDLTYVAEAVAKNREISVRMRPTIRAYGLATFSWRIIVDRYARFLRKLNTDGQPIADTE